MYGIYFNILCEKFAVDRRVADNFVGGRIFVGSIYRQLKKILEFCGERRSCRPKSTQIFRAAVQAGCFLTMMRPTKFCQECFYMVQFSAGIVKRDVVFRYKFFEVGMQDVS